MQIAVTVQVRKCSAGRIRPGRQQNRGVEGEVAMAQQHQGAVRIGNWRPTIRPGRSWARGNDRRSGSIARKVTPCHENQVLLSIMIQVTTQDPRNSIAREQFGLVTRVERAISIPRNGDNWRGAPETNENTSRGLVIIIDDQIQLAVAVQVNELRLIWRPSATERHLVRRVVRREKGSKGAISIPQETEEAAWSFGSGAANIPITRI